MPSGLAYAFPFYSSGGIEVDLGVPAATGPAGQQSWSMPGMPGDKLDPRGPYSNND